MSDRAIINNDKVKLDTFCIGKIKAFCCKRVAGQHTHYKKQNILPTAQ
jgi:hypothetical protein